MHRFFVTAESRTDTTVTLTGGIAHQIARVLRLRPNEEIVLIPTDGQNAVEWQVRLGTVEARAVRGAVIAERPGLPEPLCAVTLCAAVLKGERFDWLVQKATELGVAVIQPIITAQTIRRVGPDDTKALDRWRRIATEAAEQSGRCTAPAINAPVALTGIARIAPAPLFVAHEAAMDETLIRVVARNTRTLSVVIGPEGGLAESEIERLMQHERAIPVSLGPRILRAETAAITAVTLVLAATDNLAPARIRAWQEIRDR